MKEYQSVVTQLTRILIAAADSNKQSRLLEIAFCICVVFVLHAIALGNYEFLLTKAKKLEIYAMFSNVRTESVIDYAVTGQWSLSKNSQAQLSRYNRSGYNKNKIHDVEVTEGNIKMTYDDKPGLAYTDEFRLVYKDELQPTLYWVCGYALARNDEVVSNDSATNSPPKTLSHLCR